MDDLGSVSLCWPDDLVRLGQYQEEITARIKKLRKGGDVICGLYL